MSLNKKSPFLKAKTNRLKDKNNLTIYPWLTLCHYLFLKNGKCSTYILERKLYATIVNEPKIPAYINYSLNLHFMT